MIETSILEDGIVSDSVMGYQQELVAEIWCWGVGSVVAIGFRLGKHIGDSAQAGCLPVVLVVKMAFSQARCCGCGWRTRFLNKEQRKS